MKEVKFRAWIPELNIMEKVSELEWFTNDDDEMVCDIVTKSCRIDDTSILMQFTGLKDKNNIDIYEGDIIGFDGKADKYPYVIKWGRSDGGMGNPYDSVGFCFYYSAFEEDGKSEHYEIIGNIHENKDLL